MPEKFGAHQPRVGVKCKFYLSDAPSVEGYFDHGGARGNWFILIPDTGEKIEDMDRIESWEYIT